jgi:eukaryotic-like serine/threonine-protein kinase
MSRYNLLRKLGRGGMGDVYLAEDTSLGRKVALKFASPALEADSRARQRLLNEARAAANIDHPYVCKVYDTGELEGRVFIVMEFVEGVTVADRLRQGPLPWKEAVRLVHETAEALAQAHEKGVIHRDLKPANIMLGADGHVKVTDFGLAKRFAAGPESVTIERLTEPGSVSGTFIYMSPEQLRGRVLDPRTDIFSLGLVFYEMLTGMHPFGAGSDADVAAAILREPHKPLAGSSAAFPSSLEPIISKMLAKDAAQRYSSARQVCESLGSLEETVAPLPASRPLRTSIAVLPLVNMSSEKETEYFSDGMTEDIISELSRLRTVRVISRTSIMRYKGTQKSLREIGLELGVQNVLEGSVRRSDDHVRIVVRLVDVESDTELWSSTYDRRIGDVFAVQTDVARQIAPALKATISTGGVSRPSQQSSIALEAYQACLKGRYFLHKLRGQSIDQAVHYFERALEFDPKNARSYAGLSTCYADAGHFKYMPCVEAFAKAKMFAEKALLLDDRLAEAHASMAVALLFGEWDWERAEQSFRCALNLNPSFAEAHISYSSWLVAKLRFPAAIVEAETACELDPLSLATNLNLGWTLAFAGRLEEAQEQLKKVIEMDSSYLPGPAVLGYVYALQGMYHEAFATLERLPPNHPSVGYVHALSGNAAGVHQIVAKLSHPSTGRSRPCLDLAILYLLLGDKDEGLGWLEQACQEHDNKLIYLNCYLRLHPRELGRYRREPRFTAVSKQVHLDTQVPAE